jgi:hypothetical protein
MLYCLNVKVLVMVITNKRGNVRINVTLRPKANAPYYIVMYGLSGSPRYLINGTILGKMLLSVKCVF